MVIFRAAAHRMDEAGFAAKVNGTPLLRGIEFTHAPAQAGERMVGVGLKGESEHRKKNQLRTDPEPDPFPFFFFGLLNLKA